MYILHILIHADPYGDRGKAPYCMTTVNVQLEPEASAIAEALPAPPLLKKNARNPLIDVNRGLLIILVVIGHTGSPWNWLIYAFHMPAWFVLSGVLHRDRPWKESILSKFSSLMVPFFAANLALWAMLMALNVKGLNAIFIGDAKVYGFEPLKIMLTQLAPTNGMLGAAWFLPVLFGVSLFSSALIQLARKIHLRNNILMLGSLILALYGSRMGVQPFYWDLILFCQFYYIIGYFVIQERLFPDRTKAVILAVVAAAALYFEFTVYNDFFNVIGRRYNNVYYFLIFSLAGSYLVAMCSRVLARSRHLSALLAYLGRNSLYILLFHFIGFKMLMLLACGGGWLDRSELTKFPSSHQIGWYWYVVFAIAFSLGLAALMQWCGGKLRALLGNQFTVKRFLNDLLFDKAQS